MDEPTYTPPLVERVLRNYIDIRSTFEGKAQRVHDSSAVIKKREPTREVPLGGKNQPWPFMEKLHAATPNDGKRRARQMEDLLCSVIDVDNALAELREIAEASPNPALRAQAQEDYFLLINYHILHLYTLDELMVLRGVSSRGSMQKRVFRAVQRLTKIMES
jgi:hypothetical protein